MVLFKRMPTLRWLPPQNEDIVSAQAQASYPALVAEFKTLETELLPHFRELNASALRLQNEFRLDQVILIFGGVVATILGVLHASLGKAPAVAAGILEAVLASALSAVALRARITGVQQRYFTERLKAERLRAEYFLFLGRVSPYADEQERLAQLIRSVAEIKSGEAK